MTRRDSISGDEFGQRLRREALMERPPFSPELQARILMRARTERVASREALRFWIPKAAAAVGLLAAGAVAMLLWLNSRHSRPVPHPTIVQDIGPAHTDERAVAVSPPTIQVNPRAVVFARLWPPEVGVRLPSATLPSDAERPVADEPTAPPVSPDRLLAGMEAPPGGATAALADVVPPSVRDLIDVARATWRQQ